MKIKVVTLCSGYDSQCLALERIKENHPDFDYELIAWSDIDKYACQMHDQIFPEWSGADGKVVGNVGDMTKVDWTPVKERFGEIDLLTYSTPCQDISQAGKCAGFDEGAETRSAILWHTAKAIEILRPKYLLQENVKAIISGRPRLQEQSFFVVQRGKKEQGEDLLEKTWNEGISSMPQGAKVMVRKEDVFKGKAARKTATEVYLFNADGSPLMIPTNWGNISKWMSRVESFGYTSDWKILNSKDYGVPQNRERFFLFSQRNDIKKYYQFPDPFALDKALEDVLEDEVDEKFFLNDTSVGKFMKANDKDNAVLCQVDIPPTHENAMFLKTFTRRWLTKHDKWAVGRDTLQEEISNTWEEGKDEPTAISEFQKAFFEKYEIWQKDAVYPNSDFEDEYMYNLSRKADDPEWWELNK